MILNSTARISVLQTGFSGLSPGINPGVVFLLCCSIGVAMVSRIAKNFQDYFLNVIVQKFGAKVFTDGLQHAMKLPYQEFEDQRSGETLCVLTKVRTDTKNS